MMPTTPTSPTMPLPSPCSPRSAAVEPGSAALSPVMTLFSPSSHIDSVKSDFAMTSPTWAPANHSVCRRNSLTTPVASPQQASFFVSTPERAYFRKQPISPIPYTDGRQSRLSQHNPPSIDRVLTLPLRVNTSFYNPATTKDEEDQSPATALFHGSEEMDWSPASSSPSLTPSPRSSYTHAHTHTRRSRSLSSKVVGSNRPQNLSSSVSSRSPIRKRQRPTRPQLSSLVLPKPPPRYHVIVSEDTLSPDSLRARIQYMQSVEHLRAPLVPLISVSTGLAHPAFPTTLLQYHLLTHSQLDSLARWYHQVTPAVDETFMYPAWIPAWTSLDEASSHDNNVVLDNAAAEGDGEDASDDGLDLETKRRRFGRFIGLRGCESPVPSGPEDETPSELARRMEREWRRALERAEDDERLWEKSWRGRW